MHNTEHSLLYKIMLQTSMSAGSQALVTTTVGTQKEATPVPATLGILSWEVQDV